VNQINHGNEGLFGKPRLSKWGWDFLDVGYFRGDKTSNQLWEIIGNETSGYLICNYKYSAHCLCLSNTGNNEVGTHNENVRRTKHDGIVGKSSRWSITPLYSNAKMEWKRIEEIDNKGKQPINLTGYNLLLFSHDF